VRVRVGVRVCVHMLYECMYLNIFLVSSLHLQGLMDDSSEKAAVLLF